MNEKIADTIAELEINVSREDIETLSISIINKCAELNDSWATVANLQHLVSVLKHISG